MRWTSWLFALGLVVGHAGLASAQGTNCPAYPYTLTNGQVADANQVMGNFNNILNCANNNLQGTLSGPLAGFRNRVFNGSFIINQMGYVSGTSTGASIYAHDGWKAGSGGGTYTYTQTSPDTTITITSGTWLQIIEGANIEGGTFTLSWSGTAKGQINGGGFAASPLTVTSLPSGQNVTIEFNAGTLGKVQLEPGTTATVFERRPVALEWTTAYRYFRVNRSPVYLSGVTLSGYGVAVQQNVYLSPPMRTTPTISPNFINGTGNASQGIANITPESFSVFLVSNGIQGNFAVVWVAGNTIDARP